MCLTPTVFISKFTDLLTPSFMSALAFFGLLLYPNVLCMFRWRSESMSLGSCAQTWSKLQDPTWFLPHRSRVEISGRSLKCQAFLWQSQPEWRTHAEPSLRFLLNSRLMIWHWLESKCLNRLIQSRHPSLRQTFWLVFHEELPLNFCIIIPYHIDQISFDGFSALIAAPVITWICDWSAIGPAFVA